MTPAIKFQLSVGIGALVCMTNSRQRGWKLCGVTSTRPLRFRTIREGLEFVQDAKNAPEARLCMEARLESRFASAVRGRERRPALDLDHLHAWTTGLESQTWRSPHHYGSMLDKYDGTPRETPLIKGNK